jgi:ABC-type multidrug transport system fused ATPase/permease subunit
MLSLLGLKKRYSDFFFYYSYLGNKILITLFLSFSVGLLDGLGLAMFIPLLQLVDGNSEYDPNNGNAGNFDYLIEGMNNLGISFNLATVLLFILFFFLLKGIFRFMESYYNVVLTTSFTEKIRVEAVDSITNINYLHFTLMDSGKIQNSLSGEIDRIRQSFKYYSSSIQAFMSVLVYLTLAFFTNPQFALLVIVGGLLSNFFYSKLYKKTKKTSKDITYTNHSFHGLMIQEIQNFKYLRATGHIKQYSKKLKKTIIEIARGHRKIGFYNSILISTKEPMSILVVVIVILIQIHFFETSLGAIILSLLFFYRSLNQVIVFQNHWNSFLNYSGALYSYQGFINELKSNQLDYNSGTAIDNIDEINLIDVNFAYDNKPFLTNINLTIPKNKTIAFVGSSGSGKTTLTNIITGLLPIDMGEVMINGNNIKNLSIQQYQSKIGYITQEPVIFDDTLFNNITFWSEKTPENFEKFMDCIKKASMDDFYNNLELKEETRMGSNGVMASGGQRQRIAIAREIYKEVDLLVMDEATSALDTATEQEIQKSFDDLKGKFTFIVIAHRLSTIKSADYIYILKDGEISQSGDFLSLQEKSTDFKKMVELQGIGTR